MWYNIIRKREVDKMTVKEFVEMVEKDTIIINAQTGRKVGDWSDFQEWKVKKITKGKKHVFIFV